MSTDLIELGHGHVVSHFGEIVPDYLNYEAFVLGYPATGNAFTRGSRGRS